MSNITRRENSIFGILEASKIDHDSSPESIAKAAIDIILKSSYPFCNVVVFDFDTEHKVVQVLELDDNNRHAYIIVDEIAAIHGSHED
jgi:hypothetical protein